MAAEFSPAGSDDLDVFVVLRSIFFAISTYCTVIQFLLIPVDARSKACVCGCSVAGIVGSNLAEGMDVCLVCVLSGRGLCFGLITRPEESYPSVVCQSVIVKPWAHFGPR